MQTNSYISAAALAAALLASPLPTLAQGIAVNVDAGPVGVSADVSSGVSASVSTGSSSGVSADVDIGRAGTGSSGPNGGQLIDLKALGGSATREASAAGSGDGSLVTGDVRIAALGDSAARAQAMLALMDDPHLAELDLDAAIDDRQVAILAAADLLSPDALAEVRAASTTSSAGRDQLQAALAGSVELSAILDAQGVDPADVLAVQIADTGATEVIVLDGTARLAALGSDGNLADLTVDQLAGADVDLLSEDELAEANVALLDQAPQPTARLRVLSNDNADDGTIDLADLSVAQLADADVDLLLATPGDTGADTGTGGSGGDGGNGSQDGDDDGAGSGDGGTGTGTTDDTAGLDTPAGTPIGQLPATAVGASFGVAALGCNVGVLALANGLDASPQAIASADSLELVRIDGCERSLVDADIAEVRGAIAANPAIAQVLDAAAIPVDGVIGATIQADTLTLFIEADVS